MHPVCSLSLAAVPSRSLLSTCQAHYHTILRLKSFFPFSLIDAMGTLEEARQQIMRELRYQSSLDLDEATYAAIRCALSGLFFACRLGCAACCWLFLFAVCCLQSYSVCCVSLHLQACCSLLCPDWLPYIASFPFFVLSCRHLPLARDLVRVARQRLVFRLDAYCKRDNTLFGDVIR